MSRNYGVDIPEVKLITFPSAEADQEPSQQSIRRGRPPQIPTPMDIRWPMVQEFLRNSNLSANSQKLYERELKRFLGWTQLRWSDLTRRHLGQYKAYLMELKVAEGRKLSKNSLNSSLTALKSFFKWLTQFHPELCPTNPTKGVKFEKVPLPPAQNLTPEEMARVWDAIAQREQTQLRDLALVQLLSHNLRAGEVVGANVGSFDGRLISITKTKNNQPRLVPLSAEGQRVVQEYLDWRQERGEALSAESPLILSNHQGWEGQRLSYHGVYFAVEDIGRLAELPDLHPHQFRHTSATEYLRMGLDPAHARRLTGHTDERSFRRYTVAAEQEAAIAAFYRAEEEGQPLVFAQSLNRKQRQLLESLAERTGKPPLYQDDLDEGMIEFAQLWQENLRELERLVADVRALPEKLGMAGLGDNEQPSISLEERVLRGEILTDDVLQLEAVVEESSDLTQVRSVESSLNVVHLGMKLWVNGKKKGKVRKAIEERVLDQFQMIKPKPRGNQYELRFVFDNEDDLSQIVAQMRWDMDLLAEFDDCSVEVKWLDDVSGLIGQQGIATETGTSQNAVSNVYQLKITLLGVRPQVWRRFQVSETTTLAQLHSVIQVVMGWEGYHLHQFSDSEDETLTLAELLGDDLFSFGYLYDFGDMWQHEIKVEKRLASKPGQSYPICLVGKRACPPEDCGGDWGYTHLLRVLKNPNDPEYEERLEWVGSDFDPKAFDLEEVNQALGELEVETMSYCD